MALVNEGGARIKKARRRQRRQSAAETRPTGLVAGLPGAGQTWLRTKMHRENEISLLALLPARGEKAKK
jgi:hypothetical protein